MVARQGSEQAGDAQLAQRPQETEIVELRRNVFFDVLPQIVLELEAFGILVVHLHAGNGAFVGAVFVAQRNMAALVQGGGNEARERQHGRKRRVSVEESLGVEGQQSLVDAAVHHKAVFVFESGLQTAVARGSARIDNHGAYLARKGSAQYLERNHRVFAAAHGHLKGVLQKQVVWPVGSRTFGCIGCAGDFHKGIPVGADAVEVEKFAQAKKIQFLEPVCLLRFEPAAVDSYLRAAGAFPITHQFHHAAVKNQVFQQVLGHGIGAVEGAERNIQFGSESVGFLTLGVAERKMKANMQPVGFKNVAERTVNEQRIPPAQFFEFGMVFFHLFFASIFLSNSNI